MRVSGVIPPILTASGCYGLVIERWSYHGVIDEYCGVVLGAFRKRAPGGSIGQITAVE